MPCVSGQVLRHNCILVQSKHFGSRHCSVLKSRFGLRCFKLWFVQKFPVISTYLLSNGWLQRPWGVDFLGCPQMKVLTRKSTSCSLHCTKELSEKCLKTLSRKPFKNLANIQQHINTHIRTVNLHKNIKTAEVSFRTSLKSTIVQIRSRLNSVGLTKGRHCPPWKQHSHDKKRRCTDTPGSKAKHTKTNQQNMSGCLTDQSAWNVQI